MSSSQSEHTRALTFADHWRERGYVMQDAAETYEAEAAGPSLWIVAGHALSGSPSGVAMVCPVDCPERRR